MPNIGPLEVAVVLVIALIVFGPKRVPELGRSMGKGIREFRSSISAKHGDDDERHGLEEGPHAPEAVDGEVVPANRT
jgi:sec-independent protein translocase protein TatA